MAQESKWCTVCSGLHQRKERPDAMYLRAFFRHQKQTGMLYGVMPERWVCKWCSRALLVADLASWKPA